MWLADRDILTGLYNRQKFEKYLEIALVRAKRYDQRVALIYFDLDRFKLSNNVVSHKVGDEVLVLIAQVLRQSI